MQQDGGFIIESLIYTSDSSSGAMIITADTDLYNDYNAKSETGTDGDLFYHRYVKMFGVVKIAGATDPADWSPGGTDDHITKFVHAVQWESSTITHDVNASDQITKFDGVLYTGAGAASGAGNHVFNVDLHNSAYVRFYVNSSSGNFVADWDKGGYATGTRPFIYLRAEFGCQWTT